MITNMILTIFFLLLPFAIGSPFHPRVTDAYKVRIIGGTPPGTDIHGYIRSDVGKAYSLETETVEAGPGNVSF